MTFIGDGRRSVSVMVRSTAPSVSTTRADGSSDRSARTRAVSVNVVSSTRSPQRQRNVTPHEAGPSGRVSVLTASSSDPDSPGPKRRRSGVVVTQPQLGRDSTISTVSDPRFTSVKRCDSGAPAWTVPASNSGGSPSSPAQPAPHHDRLTISTAGASSHD